MSLIVTEKYCLNRKQVLSLLNLINGMRSCFFCVENYGGISGGFWAMAMHTHLECVNETTFFS